MNDTTETLLIVDDASDWLRGLKRLIEPELACRVLLADSALKALQLMAEHKITIVLTDIRMPDVDGMELMERIHSRHPETSVILMTAYGSIDQAVDALKKGAYDFVTKPLDERRLFHTLRNCLERHRIIHKAASLEEKLAEKEHPGAFPG